LKFLVTKGKHYSFYLLEESNPTPRSGSKTVVFLRNESADSIGRKDSTVYKTD